MQFGNLALGQRNDFDPSKLEVFVERGDIGLVA